MLASSGRNCLTSLLLLLTPGSLSLARLSLFISLWLFLLDPGHPRTRSCPDSYGNVPCLLWLRPLQIS